MIFQTLNTIIRTYYIIETGYDEDKSILLTFIERGAKAASFLTSDRVLTTSKLQPGTFSLDEARFRSNKSVLVDGHYRYQNLSRFER